MALGAGCPSSHRCPPLRAPAQANGTERAAAAVRVGQPAAVMQPVEVVDPRLAAGRGDEFRASTQRARVDELVELAAMEGEDYRCGG